MFYFMQAIIQFGTNTIFEKGDQLYILVVRCSVVPSESKISSRDRNSSAVDRGSPRCLLH